MLLTINYANLKMKYSSGWVGFLFFFIILWTYTNSYIIFELIINAPRELLGFQTHVLVFAVNNTHIIW